MHHALPLSRMPSRPFVAAFALALAASMPACSSDDDRPPPASDGVTSGGSTSPSLPGSSTDGGTTDAGPVTDGCSAVERGDVIESIAVPGEAPPPLGGAITPGIYDLNELDVFVVASDDPENNPTPVPPTESAQATLVVTADTLKIVRGVPGANNDFTAVDVRYGWMHPDGTNIVFDELCPSRASQTMPYSAAGPAIVLFSASDRNEIYKLRP